MSHRAGGPPPRSSVLRPGTLGVATPQGSRRVGCKPAFIKSPPAVVKRKKTPVRIEGTSGIRWPNWVRFARLPRAVGVPPKVRSVKFEAGGPQRLPARLARLNIWHFTLRASSEIGFVSHDRLPARSHPASPESGFVWRNRPRRGGVAKASDLPWLSWPPGGELGLFVQRHPRSSRPTSRNWLCLA